MATKTFEELKQLAIQIRDEKTNKQNTATRVGTAMLEHINKLEQDYYDKTQTDEELKERDDKLIELFYRTTEFLGDKNLFANILQSNKFLGDNGIVSEDVNWKGFLLEYVQVVPGEIIFADIEFNTRTSGFGCIWGYSDTDGSGAIRLVNTGNHDRELYIIPDGVNYIQACHGNSMSLPKNTPKLYKTGSISYITDLLGVNRFTNQLTNKFLNSSGAESQDSNYKGYLTPYLLVSGGDKYFIKGSFTNWNNIFVYTDDQGNGAKPIGHIAEDNAYIEITIPSGYSYMRVCADSLHSENVAIIKIDTEYGRMYSELLYNYFLSFKRTTDNKLSNLDLTLIKNGVPKKILGANQIYGSTIKEKNENHFIYEKSGSGNEWASTSSFAPSGNNMIHVSGQVVLTLEGGAKGIDINIADANVSGKYKNIGEILSEGKFDYSVDTSYLVAHEGYSGSFYIMFNNKTIEGGTGSVHAEVTNWQISEYENEVNGTNIQGNSAKKLFESVDNNFTNIYEKINSKQTFISPSGDRYIISVSDDGILNATPIVPNKLVVFGNSLLFGFEPYGMAASESAKDYYSLITGFIQQTNSGFTSNKYSASDFESLTDNSQIDTYIDTYFLNKLDGDEELIIIQLGDNVNNEEKLDVFRTSAPKALQKIRSKCKKARVVWIGMWYDSAEKYDIIKYACEETGCEYVFFTGLNTTDARSKVGNLTKRGRNTRTLYNVTKVTENSSETIKSITVEFTLGSVSYSTDIDVYDYSLSDTALTYESEYQIIDNTGVASHPGDIGMKRIANKVLYLLSISNVEEVVE